MEQTKKVVTTTTISDKFGGSSKDLLEEEFKKRTVGLVSAEEFKRRRDIIEKGIGQNLKLSDTNLRKRLTTSKDEISQLKKMKNVGQLSFQDEINDGEVSDIKKQRESMKKAGAPKFGLLNEADELFKQDTKAPEKEKTNIMEEDEDTIRMRQEAIEVVSIDIVKSEVLGRLRGIEGDQSEERDEDRIILGNMQARVYGRVS